MIEINLLPEELRGARRTQVTLFSMSPKRALASFAVLFVGLQVLMTAFAVVKQMELDAVRGELGRFKTAERALLARQTASKKAKATLRQVNSLAGRKFAWTRLINALSDSVTQGIWLRSLELETAQSLAAKSGASKARGKASAKTPVAATAPVRVLRIEGSAVAKGQETAFVGRFIKELKANPDFTALFLSIEPSNIVLRKIKDADVYDFTVNCVFKPQTADLES